MNTRTDGFVGALQGVELDERDARKGDRVRVLAGMCAGLQGTVRDADDCGVRVELDSEGAASARITLHLYLAEVEVLP